MWTTSNLCARVGKFRGITHDVDRHTANGREENIDIRPSEKLRIHSACIFKERTTKGGFLDLETFRHAGEEPHWIDRRFVAIDFDALVDPWKRWKLGGTNDDIPVDWEFVGSSENVELFDLDVCFGLRDGRADIKTL